MILYLNRASHGGQRARELGERAIARCLDQTAVVAGEPCTWTERRLVIRSLAQARAGETALRTRLAQAQTALADLQTRRQGKPRWTELSAVREAAEAIVARYRVQGLLRLHYEEHVCERPVRRYGTRPATVRIASAVASAIECVTRIGSKSNEPT